ncbi:MAG: class I SAM-dependent methyltransferase [Acaryochloris sp. SU_5_25]|nr:class I SAM-dependent methyltransferase [Acaryochloris sp. SU_5_25]
MQALPNLFELPLTKPALKLAYETLQSGKSIFGLTHREVLLEIRSWIYGDLDQTKPLDNQATAILHSRQDRLLAADWQDAEQGIYPLHLLFDNPWNEFFRFYPQICLDTPKIWERVSQKSYQDFTPNIDLAGYPQYYLQNFHHQTDGYLGEESADLYDLQVELLFSGTGDPMRRRVLAPLKQALTAFTPTTLPKQIRILDLACGGGRTLKQLRAAFPLASLYGVDLSPSYLRKTNQVLTEDGGELPQLIQANAESLPYVDHYFHGITSVFLFHELPGPARQAVINECFRVIQPGGVLVICDSFQSGDIPELEVMIDNFPITFHEPYYRHYSQDDLVKRLEDAGFEDIETELHFVSKYFIAHKPVAI